MSTIKKKWVMKLTTGKRIRFIRNLRNMTLKQLGMAAGFPEENADIRIAQYESGTRKPKDKILNRIAAALDVSSDALVPNIENGIGVMHTLFALEDMYGLKVEMHDGIPCIYPDKNSKLYAALKDWQTKAEQLRNGEIDRAEYDRWRYTYS
ncbi:MAG: helix-turn-helix transcriptional regulator [bacterium]|nr:helix-turn-helix transcriptional regulator [bacterium]